MKTDYKIRIKQVLTGEIREVRFNDADTEPDDQKDRLRIYLWKEGNWNCDSNRHGSFTNNETDLDELFGVGEYSSDYDETNWHRCEYGPNQTHLYLVKVFGDNDIELYSEFDE